MAAIREAKYKKKVEQYYNRRVRPETFKVGDFMYRKNEASRVEDLGKLGPNWEGPYRIIEAYQHGTYKLQTMDDVESSRPSAEWHKLPEQLKNPKWVSISRPGQVPNDTSCPNSLKTPSGPGAEWHKLPEQLKNPKWAERQMAQVAEQLKNPKWVSIIQAVCRIAQVARTPYKPQADNR
ncbi:reverse transcriptase domain-containing protein [Artemisia annua]|uniref:Reverse transcriptase domain-containing protein n=1 Tax=Artemisia annua TaxID=35608 RepID=A0A2U1KAI9_ARTAN|nr:reverse transcriptase domain-containing protein [Artemisia annua]